MRKVMIGLSVVALAIASSATAQVCNGMPGSRASVAGTVSFPQDLKEYSLTGAVSPTPGLFLSAGYTRMQPNQSGADGMNGLNAGLSYSILPTSLGSTIGLSVCPLAQFGYMSATGFTSYQVPLGVGFGASIPAATFSVHPYAVPQIIMSKAKLDFGGQTIESSWQNDFAMRGGVMFGFNRFYVGGEITKVFSTGNDAYLGIRAGIKL